VRLRRRGVNAGNELRPRLLVELELDPDDDVDEQLANALYRLRPVRLHADVTLRAMVKDDLIRGYRLWKS
jgi:hypothetical protein